jgi:hypothetical protein
MPEDRRSADVNLRDMAGKPEADAVSWWSARLSQVASIPSPTARAGALIPMMRELAALPKAQRVALTRARVLAADQLAPDQLDKILEARSVASRQAPEIEADDRAVVGEVVSTLPAEQVERMRQAAERAGIPLPAQPSSAERR